MCIECCVISCDLNIFIKTLFFHKKIIVHALRIMRIDLIFLLEILFLKNLKIFLTIFFSKTFFAALFCRKDLFKMETFRTEPHKKIKHYITSPAEESSYKEMILVVSIQIL